MVSFSCENCGDVIAKKKLDAHRSRCYGATFTCLDCMENFQGTSYRAHTSCISEEQKYQGPLYKEKKSKSQSQSQPKTPTTEQSQALIPLQAYVEDALELNGTIAVVDVPPRAPSPPPAAAAIEGDQPVNVFDFLVTDGTPKIPEPSLPPIDEPRMIEEKEYQSIIDEPPPEYTPVYHMEHMYTQPPPMPMDYGYSYGSGPLEPSFERYASYADLPATNQYTTPAPKRERDTSSQRDGENERKKGSKSEKKRKRNHTVESLDLSLVRKEPQDEIMTDAPPTLHSGLTGGLNRLMSRAALPPSPEYSGEASGPSPTEPQRLRKNRSKSEKKDKAKNKKDKSEKPSSKPQNRDAQPRKTSDSSTTRSSRHHHRSDRSDRSIPSTSTSINGPAPSNNKKRHHSRRNRSNSPSNPPRKQLKAIEYPKSEATTAPSQQQQQNQLVPYQPDDRATHFLSFVNKGPDSERGCSINKALKRWHRERGNEGSQGGGGGGGRGARSEKWEDEKELWKSLRMRRNERGEIVVFI